MNPSTTSPDTAPPVTLPTVTVAVPSKPPMSSDVGATLAVTIATGIPVAVNVSGLPSASAVALNVFTPGVAPSTHEACAHPSVPVLTVALLPPPTVPPPVTTVKVTGSLAGGWGTA